MKIVRSLPDLHAASSRLRANAGRLTLVPTMGALHDGHLALLEAARGTGGGSVVSIFVNPLQFGPKEDLSRYPRDEAADLAVLERAGCDIVWLPSVDAMYPAGDVTVIDVAGPSEHWEGIQRPGHFRGVATVCAKLFNQVGADAAFFGEKDWQQLQVVKRMVRDLHLPIEIVGIPTVRERDGLALSSRNRFLDAAQRSRAPLFYETLRSLARRLSTGLPAAAPIDQAAGALQDAGMPCDYLALVDGETLEAVASAIPDARLIAAARLGPVRLLDNVPLG